MSNQLPQEFDVDYASLGAEADAAVQDTRFLEHLSDPYYEWETWIVSVLVTSNQSWVDQLLEIAGLYNYEITREEVEEEPDFTYELQESEIELCVQVQRHMKRHLPSGTMLNVGTAEGGCYCLMVVREP